MAGRKGDVINTSNDGVFNFSNSSMQMQYSTKQYFIYNAKSKTAYLEIPMEHKIAFGDSTLALCVDGYLTKKTIVFDQVI